MFHLTDIKKFNRCNKYFSLARKEPIPFFPYAYCNYNTIDLCIEYLELSDYYKGCPNDEGTKVIEALDSYNVFVNARFVFEDLRVTIPFLIKEKSGYTVIFVFNQCYPKENEATGMADACWVLEKNHIKINNVKLFHLNANYLRRDELNVKECLILNEYLFNDKNKGHRSAFELIKNTHRDLAETLVAMRNAENDDQIQKERTSTCTHKGKCVYFDRCFNFEENPTSIYNLMQSQKKYDLHDRGIIDLSMVESDMVEGTRHQYAQIMAAKNDGLFFDYYALKIWIENQIVYPITYLDFEWETYIYPPYSGMKPYDVLVFQYSMHIEKKHKANLHHEEYIGTKDCRQEFIENLLMKIPKHGSIMVFNAAGAEKLRLQQLATQFPQYQAELQAVWERMVDLSIPFSSGNIYDSRMAGAYSLKKLVSLFSDYKYSDLEISHGMEAVKNWRDLGEENEESEAIKKALFQYCSMDTFSMIIVFHAILEILEQKSKT